MTRLTSSVCLAAALLFIVVPGHPDAWLRGVPVGIGTLSLLALLAFAWGATRTPRPSLARPAVLIAGLAVAKLALWSMAPSVGWVARYYANPDFAGEARQSTEFHRFHRLAGASRIDRAIDFQDDYLPLYFLNDADFNRGIRREVTEPVSVEWRGHVRAATAGPLRISAEARGAVQVVVDGAPVLNAAAAGASRDVTLSAGDHVIDVRYRKPADTDPLVRVSAGGATVSPRVEPAWRLAAATPVRVAARAVDVLFLLAFALACWRLLARVDWSPLRAAALAMLLLFVAQGLFAAAPYQQRAVTLSGGDDWLGFEARGRAVATGDVLLRFGQPMGQAGVYYYYPGYSYFLAAVHALGSEDLSAPIFSHFLLLCAANLLVFGIAERVFDRRTAVGALVALVAIEELAFIRHYTVTLLSENLYFLTSAFTVDRLVRFAQTRQRAQLTWSGVAGGVSALIRPAIMLFLGPAALIVAAVELRIGRGVAAAAAAVAVLMVAWYAAIMPATVRNYVVAGTPVLISEAPALSFINYNLPPTADAVRYRNMYLNGEASTAVILARILVDHPGDTLRAWGVKLGFSFGFLQLMGARLHPELVAVSVGYILAVLLCPTARAMATWPIHAFLLAHLAGMVLTMPSNYGYRLILPMYLFFPMFAVQLAYDAWGWAAPAVGLRPRAARV